jgi:hypothetical protein
VLQKGLLAPASDEHVVISDFRSHLKVTRLSVPYDSVLFIHRTKNYSPFDINDAQGQIVVFLSDATPFTAPEDMPQPWVVLCLDEVYSLAQVKLEMIEGLLIMWPRITLA